VENSLWKGLRTFRKTLQNDDDDDDDDGRYHLMLNFILLPTVAPHSECFMHRKVARNGNSGGHGSLLHYGTCYRGPEVRPEDHGRTDGDKALPRGSVRLYPDAPAGPPTRPCCARNYRAASTTATAVMTTVSPNCPDQLADVSANGQSNYSVFGGLHQSRNSTAQLRSLFECPQQYSQNTTNRSLRCCWGSLPGLSAGIQTTRKAEVLLEKLIVALLFKQFARLIYYCLHQSAPLVPTNPFHTPNSHFTPVFNIIFQPTTGSSKWYLPVTFSDQIFFKLPCVLRVPSISAALM
jgi:hypothetical protein